MSRKQPVGITGQMVQAGGGMEVPVEGWTGGMAGMGGVNGASSGGHRLEEEDKEEDKGGVEGDGAGCSEKGLGKVGWTPELKP